jgi:hypothetical protein
VAPEPGTRPATSDADGVDLTMIRWMLTLSPAERLGVLADQIRTIEQLRARATHD